MKPILITTVSRGARRFNFIVVLIICMLIPVLLPAQADTTIAGQTDPPEEPSLISPSIELISVQKSDNTIDLKASLRAKIKGTLTKLHHLKVRFYLLTDSAGQELGAVNADRNGVALINIKGESVSPDKEGNLHFKVAVAGNKSMEAGEAELTIKKALLTITPVKEDSVLTLQVKLVDISTGTETPVKEAALGVFVKRLFNPLKIGEGTTDENGEMSVTIPDGLPGDAKGNITLMARLDENEIYGNLEASAVQPWGTVVSDKPEEQPRALWSSHPPLWMLITFIILMVAVWGHYIIIVVQLIRLRKEQPVSPIHTTNN
jgi:hypothetical protein